MQLKANSLKLTAKLIAKDIAIVAGGLGFDYGASQIGHTVANGSPPLRRFFGAVCVAQTLNRGDRPLYS